MFFSPRKYLLLWNTKGHYNVGLKCTDMLLPIYWYDVTDVLEGLNTSFGVNIPRRIKCATLLATALKLINVFEIYVNIYHYTSLYISTHIV